MTVTLEGTIPDELRKNKRSRSHWRYEAAARKQMRSDARLLWIAAMGRERPHFDRCKVTITQFWCGKALDHAAVATGTAPAIDALMDEGVKVIDDDNPDIVVDFRLRHERVPHMKDRKLVVTVEEV